MELVPIRTIAYPTNVPEAERWISAIAGGALLTYGLKAQGTALRVVTGVAAAGLFHRAITGHCLLYSALDVNRAENDSGVASVRHGQGNKIEKSVTIDKPTHELYQWWRNLENLQQILPNIKSVQVEGNQSHWTIEGPGHVTFEWNAEIHVEQEDKLIAWRSLENSEVRHAGSVIFKEAPQGRGVEVQVIINYEPPGGTLGSKIAKLIGDHPEAQLEEALTRFKQLMEKVKLLPPWASLPDVSGRRVRSRFVRRNLKAVRKQRKSQCKPCVGMARAMFGSSVCLIHRS
jgi:uncharacterized membrane protein